MCRVFHFGVVCVVFIVSGCRKEKNERHFAWLLIAFFVCHNLIHMCVIVSLWSLCGISFIFSQYGGAIYNDGGALTFEGSATFTSCSAEVSGSSSSYAEAVSGGE